MYDVIIIGGGPAGMSAALYLLRNNKKVLIIEKNAFGGQIATSPHLENFPTIKSISGLEWSDLFFNQISDMGADFELEEVLEVSKTGNLFTVKTNYNEYQTYCVIAANGVTPRKLNLPNEDDLRGKGVSYCAVCDGPFYKGEESYIIGDANTALQYAVLLTDYCTKVHLYTLFDKFFGDQILINKVLNNEKIEIKHNLSLIELIGKDNLEAIKFQDTKTKEETIYKTSNVFIAIGQIPHNDAFKGLIELNKGFIPTNEEMETNVPGFFAAGDTRVKNERQVITACSDGSIAAVSALKYLSSL